MILFIENSNLVCKEMLPQEESQQQSVVPEDHLIRLRVPVVELCLVSVVPVGRCPWVLFGPAGRRDIGGGGWWPGAVPTALLGVWVGGLLFPPHVVDGGSGVGRSLGSEEFTSFLGVSLLQVGPLAPMTVLEWYRVLTLSLQEGLQLHLLLLFEVPGLIFLVFFQSFFLFFMDIL